MGRSTSWVGGRNRSILRLEKREANQEWVGGDVGEGTGWDDSPDNDVGRENEEGGCCFDG